MQAWHDHVIQPLRCRVEGRQDDVDEISLKLLSTEKE